MKRMNALSPALLLALSCALPSTSALAAQTAQHVHVRTHCTVLKDDAAAHVDCPPPPPPPPPPGPPAPPALGTLPAPPVPPVPPAGLPVPPGGHPALPQPPALLGAAPPPPPPAPSGKLPVPPAPPRPVIPRVPAAAHAACAAKAPGSALTWTLGDGETMSGLCVKRAGKMVFDLHSYDLDR